MAPKKMRARKSAQSTGVAADLAAAGTSTARVVLPPIAPVAVPGPDSTPIASVRPRPAYHGQAAAAMNLGFGQQTNRAARRHRFVIHFDILALAVVLISFDTGKYCVIA